MTLFFSNPGIYQAASSESADGAIVQTWLKKASKGLDDTGQAWGFLFNPERIQISKESRWNEVPALGVSVPELQFGYTGGQKVTLPDLLFTAYCRNKSFLDAVTGITDLMNAKSGEYAPKPLTFLMGKRKMSPLVLERVEIVEHGWTGSGNPSDFRLTLTLLSVPPGNNAYAEPAL